MCVLLCFLRRISSVRRALAGRPIWVAAYTAPGEEEAIAGVHVKLQAEWANLLTVIMPRTPARTSEVAEVNLSAVKQQ